MGDYLYQSYPMLESPSTTSESSANMASQEYYELENADLYFPIERSWFPDPCLEPYPDQCLSLMPCDTNQSFNDESQFPPQFEDFEIHYHQSDVNYPQPMENSLPEDTASRAGSK